MVSSDKSPLVTKEYFKNKGFDQILSFDELILQRPLNNFSANDKLTHESFELLN